MHSKTEKIFINKNHKHSNEKIRYIKERALFRKCNKQIRKI